MVAVGNRRSQSSYAKINTAILESAGMFWRPGTQLYGKRYTIERQLGEGGFGITYLAMKHDGKRVVIKTLKDNLFLIPGYDDRFRNEATQLAVCKHPNIVEVDNTFRHQQRFCIAMEYVEGEDLGTLVERQGYLSETEALEYIWQIGEALTYIHHKKDLLHRDVTPQNIMRRRGSSQVVLIDFGLARGFIPDITQRLTAYQTHHFAPPEQYIEQGRPGPYTDVYALAATLYYLLTKTLPTPAPYRSSNTFLTPRDHNSSISYRVHDAILKGMELNYQSRPQSVKEWLAMLLEDDLVPPTIPQPFVQLVSAKGVNYSELRDFLEEGKWKQADKETNRKMQEVMGRSGQNILTLEDINNFPCKDLRTLDHLWVKYSKGRFGFSVQKRIYQRLGGTQQWDLTVWEEFSTCVGWKEDGKFLSYSQLTFSLNARPAHLPVLVFLWEDVEPHWMWCGGLLTPLLSLRDLWVTYPDNIIYNADGSITYVEVGEMLQNGMPQARERVKLAKEILALGENDTITFIDKMDTSRRITYRLGDDVETKTLDNNDI